jgi:peptide/nickel transport system substrate-binding protein
LADNKKDHSFLWTLLLLSAMLILALGGLHLLLARANAHSSNRVNAANGEKTLIFAQSGDAETLDPADITSRDTMNIAHQLFGTLYSVTNEGQLQPYLAESSQLAPDGKSITFKIRPGLRCEDGTPLAAKDVGYSFDRAADPKLGFTGSAAGFLIPALGYLSSRVDDPLTVTLLLKKRNPILLGLISEMHIVCKAPYEKMTKEQAATHPSATGPYKLREWTPDDSIVLERNKYFTLPHSSYGNIIWRVMPEASTRSAELIAGNVDIITGVEPDQIDAINNSETARVETVVSTRRMYVGFNQKESFSSTPGGRAIKNPDVRVALQYAVDVSAICESLLLTPCQRMATIVIRRNDHSGVAPYPYDPDKAERLLDQAGYPRDKHGVRFELTLQAANSPTEQANIALAIGQYLTDVGVKTNVETLDRTSMFIPLIRQRNAGPAYLLSTGGALWSEIYDMSDLATQDSGTNYTNWEDPKFFDGWAKFDQTNDPVVQQAIINGMLREFAERGPWLFLFCQPDSYGISKKIHWHPRADEQITLP